METHKITDSPFDGSNIAIKTLSMWGNISICFIKYLAGKFTRNCNRTQDENGCRGS